MSENLHNDRWWRDPLGQPAWMRRWKPRPRKPSIVFWLNLAAAIAWAVVAGLWLALFLASPRHPWPRLLNVAFFGFLSSLSALRLPRLRREAAAVVGDGAPGR